MRHESRAIPWSDETILHLTVFSAPTEDTTPAITKKQKEEDKAEEEEEDEDEMCEDIYVNCKQYKMGRKPF